MDEESREPQDQRYSRRQFMVYDAVLANGTGVLSAMETVQAWADEHPDVDMDEQLTWAEWHAQEQAPAEPKGKG